MAQFNELHEGETVYLQSGQPVIVRKVYADDNGVWVSVDDGKVVHIQDIHIAVPSAPAEPDSPRD